MCASVVGGRLGEYRIDSFRYESAGDQFLGRVAGGLPVIKSAFAMLPPHFDNPQDLLVLKCVEEMFPSL